MHFLPAPTDTKLFLERLQEALCQLGWQEARTLVAVSGGADSVALLRALCHLGWHRRGVLVAAHFNHRLRGAESDEDEQFVRELCHRLEVPVITGRPPGEGLSVESKGGIEQSARLARYRFLFRVAKDVGARYVFTAHTADDQVETVLFRIIRGSGLRGLVGIPPCRKITADIVLMRPFLAFWRDEIREFLVKLDQQFRRDSSNLDLRITRNRVRHKLIPLLEESYHPGVRRSILKLSVLAGEVTEFLTTIVEAAEKKAIAMENFERLVVNANYLVRYPNFLIGEILQRMWQRRGWPLGEMTRRHWETLVAMAHQAAAAGSAEPKESESSARDSPADAALPEGVAEWKAASCTLPALVALALEAHPRIRRLSRIPSQWKFPGNLVARAKPGLLEFKLEDNSNT